MQAVIDWVVAHSALVAGLVVGLLDLAFALSPGLAGNGVLHQVYLWLKSLTSKTPPPATP